MMFRHFRAWRHAHAFAHHDPCDSDPQFRSFDESRRAYQEAREQRRSSLHFSFAHGRGGGREFGVRRPLRHLAWKLELDDSQVQRMADILNRMKTARAQAALDRDRADADLAELYDRDEYSAQDANAALAQREQAVARLNADLATALQRIHEVLASDQRREFARLLRAGEFTL